MSMRGVTAFTSLQVKMDTRPALLSRENEDIHKESKEDDVRVPETTEKTSTSLSTSPRASQSGKGGGAPPRHNTSTTMGEKVLQTISGGGPDTRADPEQVLFEKRLYEESVAIRKINPNGKPILRQVRCIPVDGEAGGKSTRSCSSRSAGSWGRKRSHELKAPHGKADKKQWALTWGKKNDVYFTLDRFVCVRKGKTTDRTKRNSSPASRLLSIITDDPECHLDIEAPTKMDRDKFAKAFSKFLDIPMHEEVVSAGNQERRGSEPQSSVDQDKQGSFYPPPLAPRDESKASQVSSQVSSTNRDPTASTGHVSTGQASSGPIVSVVDNNEKHELDSHSDVSSITGHGYDAEIVEELHHALNEMRAELEESRAEAARAVKVAEQAIQSAERSNSVEWQNTVTHKAAEAAALAQKRSAEAMAKQRLAEERLEAERRTAAFWRKQAEIADEEAGVLQTRAAAAEVQRAAMECQLESERRALAAQVEALRLRLEENYGSHRDDIDVALERNRVLEVELDRARREMEKLSQPQDQSEEAKKNKKRMSFKKKAALPKKPDSKSLVRDSSDASQQSEVLPADQVLKIQAEATALREQFELFRRATTDELNKLPQESKEWAGQVMQALTTSQKEADRLRKRLAFEAASRRKLLHEVQDLRGNVRVYCRPRPFLDDSTKPLLSLASQEIIMFHRNRISGDEDLRVGPMSFQFDRVFHRDSSQYDVYTEIEEVCLGVLDGFNICVMAFGPTGCGKTYTLSGDLVEKDGEFEVENHGVQLRSLEQVFLIADQRRDRYKDKFHFTVLEVCNDRLTDLLAGTDLAEARGEVIMAENKPSRKGTPRSAEDDASSGKCTKLEIRTDVHGDTVVQGLLSVEVDSYETVSSLWKECLSNRRRRLAEQGINATEYDAACHVIATLKVVSSNIATGIGSIGKLQFVDLAGSEVIRREAVPPSSPQKTSSDAAVVDTSKWKFANRSLETLNEVVAARSQFNRSVPYRNSSLTHILRDSLEHDTKVIFMACVSSDPKDAKETDMSLQFASRISKLVIGKATKHTISPP